MNNDQRLIFTAVVTDFCEVLKDNYLNGEHSELLERDFYDFVTGLQTMYVVMNGVLGLDEVGKIAGDIWEETKGSIENER